jgi:hypothetical protein
VIAVMAQQAEAMANARRRHNESRICRGLGLARMGRLSGDKKRAATAAGPDPIMIVARKVRHPVMTAV